jgi:hypothetical protein
MERSIMSRLAFVFGLVVLSGVALGQQLNQEQRDLEYYNGLKMEEPKWNFDTSVESGITYLVFNHAHNNAFYSRTGAFVDGNVNFHLPDLHLPVVFGAGLTASGFWDNDSFLGVESLYSQVYMCSLEGRISVPIMLDEPDSGPFLLPRLGLGPLVNYYGVQVPFGQTHYHTGGAFEARPSIEFGYRYGEMAVGVEFAYMWAWGSFGDFGTQAQEVRGGLLFSYRF